MTWGFERGRVYNRRADIHARFDGQRQGGIITPGAHNVIFIITGEAGQGHGYDDRLRDDGVFEYFGEGQKGDMPWVRGNAAIRDHAKNGKDLLLFKKTRAGLRFEDQMVCAAFHYERAPDTDGADRQAIVFELLPLGSVVELVNATPEQDGNTLAELKAKALAAAGTAASVLITRTVFERSRDVRDYVLARAGNDCEGCNLPAPFMRRDGKPYLEAHHIRRVSDGGPDDPRFVIGLCPNCHRRVHAGADGAEYNAGLLAAMGAIER